MEEIQQDAARWVLRREQADWTDVQEAELRAWLEQSPAHEVAYLRLEHGWAQASRLSGLTSDIPVVAEKRYTRVVLAGALAASLVAAVSLSLLGVLPGSWLDRTQSSPKLAAISTQVGWQKTISLPDGSRIELNTDTAVAAALEADERQFWLSKGEAFFQVAHAPERPFVVHAGANEIVVLGTKFSVRREDDKLTVSVLEGRVRIRSSQGSDEANSATIGAGDIAVIEGRSVLVIAGSGEQVVDSLAWRDGILVFDQNTMEEVANEFNRYNDRKLVIADPELAQRRIGGSFQWSNLDAFVRLMKDAYSLRVNDRGDTIELATS